MVGRQGENLSILEPGSENRLNRGYRLSECTDLIWRQIRTKKNETATITLYYVVFCTD